MIGISIGPSEDTSIDWETVRVDSTSGEINPLVNLSSLKVIASKEGFSFSKACEVSSNSSTFVKATLSSLKIWVFAGEILSFVLLRLNIFGAQYDELNCDLGEVGSDESCVTE